MSIREFRAEPEVTAVSFTKVSLPWGWLGNMSRFPIEHEGKLYPTAEALFQALRFAPENPLREEIRLAQSPFQAKLIAKARQDEMIIEQRSAADLDLMRFVLRAKVTQNAEKLAGPMAELRGSGRVLIIEDCTKRQGGSGLFWGAALIDPESGLWRGENWLGRLWNELLEELGEPAMARPAGAQR